MGRFTVGITRRDRDPNARCFEDFAKAMAEALRRLGHDVVDEKNPGRLLLFGGNNVSDAAGVMPPDTILYNAEQVSAVDMPKLFVNAASWSSRIVWEYAQSNIATMKKLGMRRVVHCPVGYIEPMTKPWVQSEAHKDIDVLFYGSLNDRRRKVLGGLVEAGLKVVHLFKVYGDERDAVIARSKVVLNMHYYPGGVFEIFRCSHLFANRVCVVSEAGGCDETLEALAARTTRYVPIDEMVEACKVLVSNQAERTCVAENGFEEFKKIDLVENVRQALLKSGPQPTAQDIAECDA